jgi:hypothetical protein
MTKEQAHDKIAKHMTKDMAQADEVSITCEIVCLFLGFIELYERVWRILCGELIVGCTPLSIENFKQLIVGSPPPQLQYRI